MLIQKIKSDVSNVSAHLASHQMSALAQLPTASPHPEAPIFNKKVYWGEKKVLEAPAAQASFFGVSLNSSICTYRQTGGEERLGSAWRTRGEHMFSASPPIAAGSEPCQHLRSAPKRKFCNGFGDGLPPDGRRVQMGSGCNIGPFQFPDLLREEPRPKDAAVAWGEVEFTRQE